MSDTLRIAALIRTEQPRHTAAEACRRLIDVVAEWPADHALEVTVVRGSHRSVTVQLRHQGPARTAWVQEVRWALAGVADLRTARPLVGWTAPAACTEVRASTEVVWQSPVTEGELADPWAARVTEPTPQVPVARVSELPWPLAVLDDAGELIGAVAASGAGYRVQLAPATDVERAMVRDAVRRTWEGPSSSAARYVGRAVRLRCLVAHQRGAVPAGVRAVVRRWADHLELVDQPDPAAAWSAGPEALVGRAVPIALAQALVRLPVAGSAPVPGLSTRLADTRTVPLDPVPVTPGIPVRLGAATTAGGARVAATMSPEDLLGHVSVLGMTGTGKSSLLLALVLELLDKGVSCTVIDPHGSLATAIAREAPASVADRVLVVRHGDAARPVPLNPLRGGPEARERAIAAVVSLIQEQYDPGNTGIVSARWHTWFGLGAAGTCALLGDRASLVAVALVLMSQERTSRLASALRTTAPELSGRIRRELVDLSGREGADLFSWAASKLSPWLAQERLRGVLGTGADAVDLGDVMRRRQALVIDLAVNELGRSGARLLGTLWVLKHVEALGRVASPERPHVLVVDEAHLFEHGGLPVLLAEGRKWGVGVVAATQEAARLSGSLAGALDANAGSFVALRTGLRDVGGASARLGGWAPGDLLRLPRLRAAARLSRDGVPTEPFTLELDHWSDRRRAGVTDDERAEQQDLVEDYTRDVLHLPHADLRPVTEEEIDAALAAATPRARPGPRPGTSLEEWFADHADADDGDALVGESGGVVGASGAVVPAVSARTRTATAMRTATPTARKEE